MTSDRLKMKTKRVPDHSTKSQGWIEQGDTLMRLTVLIGGSFSKKQECCTYQATNPIGHEIIPSGMPAREIKLMPFIHYPDQQRSQKSCNHHARALQPAGQSDSESKDGVGSAMHKFVPWRRNQIDSNRLRTQKKQIEYHPQNQNCRRDSQVTR